MTVNINWDKLAFRLTPTKTMFINHCASGKTWGSGQFIPFGDINISPAAAVLNYGQGIFEGLKAHRTKTNDVVLFRPIENAKRFAHGAEEMCMPPYPVDAFINAMKEIVRHNADYIPPYGKGSLYIRPCLWGTGPILGVAPSPEYTFLVYTSPVGNYYHGELKPIKLVVTQEFHRAAPKGVGHIKFIGNYTGALKTSKQAKNGDYNGCLYLDACDEQYIEEVGTSNFFCVKEGQLLTPALGSILPGVTRSSIIQLAKDHLGMDVIERKISIEEALTADECFCSGTAAVITPIGSINYQNHVSRFNDLQVGDITQQLYDLLTGIQLCEKEDRYDWIVAV